MSEGGGKKVDRRGKLAAEPFDVEVARDKVFVRFRGRLVRTLTGPEVNRSWACRREAPMRPTLDRRSPSRGPEWGEAGERRRAGVDADVVRAVIDDPEQLQLLVARKTGNFRRGDER